MPEQPSNKLPKKTMNKVKGQPDFSAPFMFAPYDDRIAIAVTAVVEGNANEGQQKLAIDWIINSVCGYYDISFRPGDGGARLTDFAEGKRFVAAQIVKMTRLKIGRLQGGNDEKI